MHVHSLRVLHLLIRTYIYLLASENHIENIEIFAQMKKECYAVCMAFFIRSIVVLLSFFSMTEIFAATGFISYTPAPQIYLSGANSDVHFDVAGVLFDSGSAVPAVHLNTSTKSFSGVFYLSGAGWVMMSTGSYSVAIDCGSQSLSSLTASCTLSGTAYSENI